MSKRIAKVLRWLLAIVLLLLLVAGLGVVWLLSSDYGLRQIQERALPVVNEQLNGSVSVSAIKGSALGELQIEGASLRDAKGNEVVSAQTIKLEWSPGSLAGDTIVIKKVELLGPKVDLVLGKDGVNIAKIFPKDPNAPDTPIDLPGLKLTELIIQNGDVRIRSEDGSELATVSGLDTRLNADIGGPYVQGELHTFTASVGFDGQEYAVAASAETVINANEGLNARRIDVRIDQGRLQSESLELTFDPFSMRGKTKVSAPRELVQKLSQVPEIRAGAHLDLQFERSKDGAWSIEAKGKAAKAPVVFKGGFDESPFRIHGHFEADALNPARIHSAAPQGRLYEVADFDVTLVPLPNGTVTSATRGIVKIPLAKTSTRVDIDNLDLKLQLENGLLRFNVASKAEGARLNSQGSFDPTANPMKFGRTQVRLTVPRISRVLPQGRGSALLEATVSGALEDLAVKAHVEMDGLAAAGVELEALAADVDAEGVWKHPEGQATLHASNLQFEGRKIDAVNARVEALAIGRDNTVDIKELTVSSGALVLDGEGGRLRLGRNGEIELKNLGLRSPSGSIALSGSVAAPGWPRGATNVQLTLEDFDLSQVPETLAPELQGYQGRLNAQASLQKKRKKMELMVLGSVKSLVLPAEGPPVDVDLRAELVPELLTTKFSVKGVGVGNLAGEFVTTPPRDPLDIDGWKQALAEHPVERAQADFSEVNVGPLLEVVGASAPVSGRLSGFAAVGKDGLVATADIDARNLEFLLVQTSSQANPKANLRAKFQFDKGNTGVNLDLNGGAFGKGRVEAWLQGPEKLFDIGAWIDGELQLVQRLDAELKGIEVPAVLALAGGPEGIEGRGNLTVNTGPALEPMTAQLKLRDVRYPEVDGIWMAETEVTLGAGRLSGELRASHRGKRVATATVSAPLSLGDLLGESDNDWKDRPLSGSIDVHGFALGPLGAMTGIKKPMSGTMVAKADVRGTLSDPKGQLHLELKNARIDDQDFDGFVVDGSLSSDRGAADLKISQPGGGNFDFVGEVDLSNKDRKLKSLLKVDKFRVDFISGLGLLPVGVRGFLEGQMELKGPLANPEPRGRLKIHELRLVVPIPQVAPLHDGFMDLRIYDYKANFDLKAKANPGDFDMFTRIDLRDLKNIKLEGEVSTDDYPISAVLLALVTTDMKIKGQGSLKKFSVVANILNGTIKIPEESGENLLPIENQEDIVYVDGLPTDDDETSTSSTGGFKLDLKLETAEPIVVEGNAVRARFDQDLSVTTVPKGVEIGGKLVNRDGSIDLVGRQYVIERANLLFDRQVPPNPAVQVRLRHDFPSVTFYVVVEGTAENPDLRFETQPPGFGEAELFAIFLGTDPEDLNSGGTNNPGAKAAGAVGNLLLGQVNSQLRRALPVDTIDLELGGDEFGAETKLTIGKWITSELFVAYRYIAATGNSGADARVNAHEAVVQYRFHPGWLFELNIGDALFFGGDLFWIRRF